MKMPVRSKLMNSSTRYFNIYFLNEQPGRDEVSRFFDMLEVPDNYGKKIRFPLHPKLSVGDNVRIRVPSAVTQKLKITVLEEVDGKEKKWASHIELPRSEVHEKDNMSEYQNIRMLLVVSHGGNYFSFPIERSMGQRGTPKEEERTDKELTDSKLIFFSKAKMPDSPIKKKLKKLGVEHMSFLFLVDGQVVPDKYERKVTITTENSVGAEKRRTCNKRSRDEGILSRSNPGVNLPKSNDDGGEDDDMESEESNDCNADSPKKTDDTIDCPPPALAENNSTVIFQSDFDTLGGNDTCGSFFRSGSIEDPPLKKRRANSQCPPVAIDTLLKEMKDQVDYLMEEGSSENVKGIIESFSTKFTPEQLKLVTGILDRLAKQKQKWVYQTVDSWISNGYT